MAKNTDPVPTAEQLSAARALVAAEDSRIAAEAQAKRDAADHAVRDLVSSPEFKALFPMVESANIAAPRSVEVQHMTEMMERLTKAYPA